MRLRTTLVSIAVSAACAAGVVTGAPAGASPPDKIGYTAGVRGQSVVFSTNVGSLRTDKGRFEIVDGRGRVAVSLPLSYRLGTSTFPIAASQTGRTATLTPQVPPGRKLADAPTTRAERDRLALNNLTSNVNAATVIAGLIGTIVGAGVGCVASLVIPVLAVPIPCLSGAVVGGAIGGLIGTIAVGGPVLIASAIEYFRTINTPFVPPTTRR